LPLASEYLWNLASEYQRSAEAGNAIGRFLFRAVTPYVREFDRRAAQTVTAFIANSRLVRDRVKSRYRRNSVVIHPPINGDDFAGEVRKPADFYLVVSQLVPYKRVDIAVAACTRLGRKLIIIGEGSERRQCRILSMRFGDRAHF
jgi:glycosyltransferase involved in cell wall biosynthesis